MSQSHTVANPRHLAEKPQNTNSQMALKCITVKQSAFYFPVRRLQNKKRQIVMRNRTMTKHNQPASQTHKTIGATIHHESNNVATVLERSAEVTGGLSYFYFQIFALKFAVVKSEKNVKIAWRFSYLSNVSSLRNNQFYKHTVME